MKIVSIVGRKNTGKTFNELLGIYLLIRRVISPIIPFCFVGSVAFVFEKELTEALERHSLKLGKIMRSPICGMVNYHTL